MLEMLGLAALIGLLLGFISLKLDDNSTISWFDGATVLMLYALMLILSAVNSFVKIVPAGIPWCFTAGYIFGSAVIGAVLVSLDEWFGIKIRL